MNHRNWIVIAIVGLLASSAAYSVVVTDPMHCEAKVLNNESRYYRCLAVCDRRLEANDGFNVERCEERCRAKLEKALARVERRPRCRPPTADPNLCEAHLLKIESQSMSCHSRCDRNERRVVEFDHELCGATCDENAEQATEEELAGILCSEGRANVDSE